MVKLNITVKVEGFDSLIVNYKHGDKHGITTLYYENGQFLEQKYIYGILDRETIIKE